MVKSNSVKGVNYLKIAKNIAMLDFATYKTKM